MNNYFLSFKSIFAAAQVVVTVHLILLLGFIVGFIELPENDILYNYKEVSSRDKIERNEGSKKVRCSLIRLLAQFSLRLSLIYELIISSFYYSHLYHFKFKVCSERYFRHSTNSVFPWDFAFVKSDASNRATVLCC